MKTLTFRTDAPKDTLPHYLVCTQSKLGLSWFVASCFPDEGLFVSDDGIDIPFPEVVCWATLPEEVAENE